MVKAKMTSKSDLKAKNKVIASPSKDDRSSSPHYLGHRTRLRERFVKASEWELADYELMELILFRAVMRRDVKPLAKKLIHTFGSFAAALSAEPARLKDIDGVTPRIMQEFKLIRESALRLVHFKIPKKQILSSLDMLIEYCTAAMAHESIEQFRILFLDRKNTLIADEKQQRGTVDHTPVYPREVVKRALELQACAIILIHNHPSGDPSPSGSDLQTTYDIVQSASALHIDVLDHFIIGKDSYYSFRQQGLLDGMTSKLDTLETQDL